MWGGVLRRFSIDRQVVDLRLWLVLFGCFLSVILDGQAVDRAHEHTGRDPGRNAAGNAVAARHHVGTQHAGQRDDRTDGEIARPAATPARIMELAAFAS